ncbi:hypothetical protein QJS66_11010 [Kocuria rhizophila]|nr:hypothetical protein QJS66_11010 [Kocuria rhizophila]
MTTGGTGQREDETTSVALEELGAHLILDGVAQEPAHGVILGEAAGGRPVVLALPGSPLCAMTGLLTVGHALIAGPPSEDCPPPAGSRPDVHWTPWAAPAVIPAYSPGRPGHPEPTVSRHALGPRPRGRAARGAEDGMRPGQDMEAIRCPGGCRPARGKHAGLRGVGRGPAEDRPNPHP